MPTKDRFHRLRRWVLWNHRWTLYSWWSIRNTVSYIRFVIICQPFHRTALVLLAIISLAMALRTMVHTPFPRSAWLGTALQLALSFSALVTVWDTITGFFDLRRGRLERAPSLLIGGTPRALECIEAPPTTPETHATPEGPMFTSPALNTLLRNANLPDWELIKSQSALTRVRREIRAHRAELIGLLSKKYWTSIPKQMFHNEAKFCLSTTFPPPDGDTLIVHRGSYFDTWLTNEACQYRMERSERDSNLPPEILVDYTRRFPAILMGSKLQLTELGVSTLSNSVGISCLAFTSDRRFVIWQQSRHVQHGQGKLIPTCSASSDWQDIVESRLRPTIAQGMRRELMEESRKRSGIRISGNEIGEVRIIGYFRWVARGGKPEFLGVTRLTCSAEQIAPDDIETRDVQGGYRLSNAWDASNYDSFCRSAEMLEESARAAGLRLSVPLLLTFAFIHQWAKEDKVGFDAFVGADGRTVR